MILAVSRFKKGLERPRLLESAPGFLGVETFTDASDPSTFALVTRWTDRASFERWQRSEQPDLVELRLLERVADPVARESFEELAADRKEGLARFLARSRACHLLVIGADGAVRACNETASHSLGVPITRLLGTSVYERLVEPDRERLRRHLGGPERAGRLRLNFVGSDESPYTLECFIDARADEVTLLGEPTGDERALRDEVLAVNRELNVLARENARLARKLDAAVKDLEASHWKLKKIYEYLPICMECGRVKGASGEWEDLVTFLKTHSDFLTHGYCPPCFERVRARFKGDGP